MIKKRKTKKKLGKRRLEQIEDRLFRYARSKRLKGATQKRYVYGTMNRIMSAQRALKTRRKGRK